MTSVLTGKTGLYFFTWVVWSPKDTRTVVLWIDRYSINTTTSIKLGYKSGTVQICDVSAE